MPIRTYLEIALLWARFRARNAVVPEHIRENLRAAFATDLSPAQIEQVAQRYLEFREHRHLKNVLALRGFWGSAGYAVDGVGVLKEALAFGRGVLLVSAHVGYPRLIAPVLRARAFAVSAVAFGGSLEGDIAAGLDVRPILGAMARNECVVVLGDGMQAVQFAKLTFLGNDYPFASGFIRIATATGAPVLPVWCLPGDRPARIRVEIHPPLEIDPSASLSSNLEVFVRLLEGQVRRTPHLWERWGVPDVFRKAIQWSESDLRDRMPTGGWKGYSPPTSLGSA